MAKQLLSWAQEGLKVLFVHDTRELKWLHKKQYFHYPQAAASSQGLDGRDKELAQTVQELLSLSNVAEVSQQSQTLPALRRLGVRGRAEFATSNPNFLSHLRDDGPLSILYLYHFLYDTGKASDVEVRFDSQGAVSRLDAWTGSVTPYHKCRTENGEMSCMITLQPGEVTILILDRNQAATSSSKALRRSTLIGLDEWNVTIEDWNAGEIQVVKQDRGLGYETIEHKPLTQITKIDVGTSKLIPWKDMAKVGPEVSGVGEYRSTFNLPADVNSKARFVLNLGSNNGGLGSVTINGSQPKGFDTSGLDVDLTGSLRSGENEILIRVSSSLNNRLLQRGYKDKIVSSEIEVIYGVWEPEDPRQMYVREYGLLGPVKIYRESWE